MSAPVSIIDTAAYGLVKFGQLDPYDRSWPVGALEAKPVLGIAAAIAEAVAATTIQARQAYGTKHRIRAVEAFCTTPTAVAGVAPTVDVFRHLPVPPAPTAALVSPAAAGNVDNGAHDFAVEFVNAAGDTTPGPVVSVTVTDKTTNGKVLIHLPIGPTGTTARKVISSKAGAHVLYVAATVADNTTTTYTYNIADSSLSVGAATANTAGATILSAPISLASGDVPYLAVPADVNAPVTCDACIYTVRVVTGATTGAIAGLGVNLISQMVEEE